MKAVASGVPTRGMMKAETADEGNERQQKGSENTRTGK